MFIRTTISMPSLIVCLFMASCGQPETNEKRKEGEAELRLGMTLSEAKESLEGNGINLYFKESIGGYGAYDAEYEDYLSRPLPASTTAFYTRYMDFNEEGKLIRANIEINGERIILGEQIEVILDAPNSDAEQGGADLLRLPDFSGAFPDGSLLTRKTMAGGRVDRYEYTTNLVFDDLKKNILELIGQGWVEKQRDPDIVEAAKDSTKGELIGSTALANPDFPRATIGLSLVMLDQNKKFKAIITVIHN